MEAKFVCNLKKYRVKLTAEMTSLNDLLNIIDDIKVNNF